MEVKRGDTLDFIVACRENPESDGFTWAPVVRLVHAAESAASGPMEWDAETGFGGPPPAAGQPLSAWERYCQVLLLANEFDFVD